MGRLGRHVGYADRANDDTAFQPRRLSHEHERGVVVVETVQTTMFRGFLGGRDSGVALSLGAEPITPLINSGLSSSKNI